MTDPTARIVWDDYKGRIPQTPAEFALAFLAPGAAIENRMDMDSYRNEFVGKPVCAPAYQHRMLCSGSSCKFSYDYFPLKAEGRIFLFFFGRHPRKFECSILPRDKAAEDLLSANTTL